MSLTLHDIMLTLRFGVADSLFNPYVRVIRAGVEISRQVMVPTIPKPEAVLPAVKNSREAVANAASADQIVRAFRVALLPLTSLDTPLHARVHLPSVFCRCTVWISSSVTMLAQRSSRLRYLLAL